MPKSRFPVARRATILAHPTPDTRYRHGRGFRSIGEVSDPIVRRCCERFGFPNVQIVRDWPRIVGAHFAPHCRPARLFLHGRKRVLHVRASAAWATEIEHDVPVMLERIRLVCGHGAVDRIRITQISGYIRAVADSAPRDEPTTILEKELDRVRRAVASVPDPDLRDRLERFGVVVRARDPVRILEADRNQA